MPLRLSSPHEIRTLLLLLRAQALRRSSHTAASPHTKAVIFSGIQPTGIPHLGNYLGALRPWQQLQTTSFPDTKLLYSIVDLHAITVRQDAEQLRRWKRESLAVLLATGLDPQRSTIFYQSDVPQHTELMWILSCSSSMGYLSRMTHWKAKLALPNASDQTALSPSSQLRLGLFSYPVLQAADILVHRATHVPVGADQAQHLEFARELANSFNHSVSNPALLPQPQTLLSPAKKIMSLRQPTLKMSKSHPDPRSRILITDSEETISAKIASALTDSIPGPVTFDRENRPGVSNLLAIVAYLRGGECTPEAVAGEMQGLTMREVKEEVAREVENGVGEVRGRFEGLMAKEAFLDDVAAEGGRKARESAEKTLGEVKAAVGLR